MELLKGKRAQAYIDSYERSTVTEVTDVYANPSISKRRAEQDCRMWMAKQDGYLFRIISYNTFGFTCGWLFEDENNIYLRVETKDNSYRILYTSKNYQRIKFD